MRKRLVLFSILICSIFCIFGCNKDPYKNMALELVSGDTEVQLNIEEINDNGQTTYTYDTYSFDVQVKNVGDDINKKISISGGEDIVDYSLSYIGKGVTRVNITPKSNEKTGKFKLTIKTLEGNKSLTLDFQVDLKINNFTINENNLQVISKGQTIDLRAIEKYINFFPTTTTQKNIEFSVVVPNVVSLDNGRAEIDGHRERTYVYNPNGTYASVENGVLKTYKNVNYPKMIDTVVVGGNENQEIYTTCITLKATSKDSLVLGENGDVVSQKIPDRYVDIVVLEDCDNVSLKMNSQKDEGLLGDAGASNSFVLEKNNAGEYDVTLINPNYRYGVQYDTYYIERDLIFDFGEISDDGSYNPNDYYVSTSPVAESDDKPIALSYSTLDNSFKVQAQKAGDYKHIFKVDHVQFPNIIDKEIVVNFHVLDIPTSIKINGSAVKDEYKIYKNYGNSWGTRFTVSLTNANSFNYFVFLKDESLNGNLKFYKADGTEQVFAKCKEEGGIKVISSTKEGIGYSNFKSNETFYLRHNFDTLPSEDYQIYIGVMFDVASSSYSEEVKENYFVKSLLEFPINLSFEIGLQSLEFTKDSYVIDLTNPIYNNDKLDADGIKLLELPAGQSLESVISLDNIVYDHSLITVYPIFDDIENKVSLYVKCNSDFKSGKTDLTITSKNGLKNSVSISTFIPTMYAENLNMPDENQMPISIGFSDDEVLYYFSTIDNSDPHKKFEIYKTTSNGQEIWNGYEYDSLYRLILLKDSTIDLRFYDYLLTTSEDGLEKYCTPIDITDKVKVTFSDPGFAVYSNGRLSVSKVTLDINNPVYMNVAYTGGYIKLNDEGEEEYKTYKIEQKIELYIYLPLQGVTVTTPKTVDIYVDESLGIYSKDLAKHTIISDFIPNEVQLGAGWNQNWFNASIPVNLSYDIDDVLASPIYLSNGNQLIVYSADGAQSRGLIYGDLFEHLDGDDYTCPIHCKISDSLREWIESNGYGSENIDWFINNKIFNNNISMVVNVYITQFSKLQNINSVKFSAKYASKISNFDLDVADDGVYFEKRDNNLDELITKIAYSIDATNAVNKEIMLINSDNIVFNAYVTPDAIGTKGTITIRGVGAGVEYLTAVPKDNIKSYNEVTKTYTYYNNKLVKTFRIKVADGSAEYPFEISSVEKYVAMQEDVQSGIYYNYILSRNINLAEIANPRIVFSTTIPENKFSLNGLYTYYKDGVEYTQYNKLMNLYIKENISNLSKNVNIGLFENINAKVTLRNISLINAKIDLQITSLNGKNLNVGLLAGTSDGGKIYNSYCVGSIRIVNLSADSNPSQISLGGMIGLSNNITIDGLPGAYIGGYSNDAYNTNVNIDYSQMLNKVNGITNALNNHYFNVGGLVGYDKGSTFNNVKVLSTIVGTNYNSSVGGVLGNSYCTTLNQVVVYPNIKITDAETDEDNIVNVSNMIGSGDGNASQTQSISVSNSKVYFVKEEYKDWELNLSTIVESRSQINFGGIIGNLNNNNAEIKYSYVRSFYSEEVIDEYYANMYINAENGGNIGGLVGTPNSSKLIISNSYFDADILVGGTKTAEVLSLKSNTNLGLLVGNGTVFASGSKITDSYAIGNINVIYLDESSNTIIEKQKGICEFTALLGGITLADDGLSDLPSLIRGLISPTATIKSKGITNLTISNVYGVVNTNNYYFGLSDKLIGLYEADKVLLGTSGIIMGSDVSQCGTIFQMAGFALVIDSANAKATGEQWIWNDNANKVEGIAFSILLNEAKTKALYDLIPERIIVDRVASDIAGFYDVSYEKTIGSINVKYTQIIMFTNKNATQNQNNYYDVVVNSDTSSISLKFDGETVITSFLEINSDIVLSEDSSGQVISLVGSKIYPVGEGVATLTIRSALDKTVKLEIYIKVVSGITGIDLIYENVEDKQEDIPVVYIDEVSNFKFINVNEIDGIRYNSSKDFAYKVDILDCSDNGKISINGKEFVYNSVDESKNSYIFNTNSFVVKGISIGIVKFKITPILYIDEFEHVADCNYKVLDNICSEYSIYVRARAKSISIDKEEIKIAPKNTTTFNVAIETSNVIVKDVDETDPENITCKINFLSALQLKIGSKIYSIKFSDNGGLIEYDAKLSDGSFYISDFIHEIDFEIIRLRIQGIKVFKTTFDAQGNENTYNVVFNIGVSFNSSYYRANADEFDLNTIKYELIFKPESNDKLSDNVSIGISPNILGEIFTNYYSRGELLINSDNEVFPSENESNFVVPGTSGLLKITLDEEFSDSSYITVTLDKIYQEYVTLNQMAGVINQTIIIDDDATDYIDSYKDIKFKQTVDNTTEYGIRLAKLTLNYNDQNYFSRTYFVKLGLIRNYGNLDTINLKITSYKVENQVITINKIKTISLDITELPLIDVKVDNEYSAVIGKGIIKPLEITQRGLSNDIEFGLYESEDTIYSGGRVYIVDEEGNKVNILNIDYLKANKKYYLCADVTADLKALNLKFQSEEMILGVREYAKSDLKIQIVDFEIDSIKIDTAIDGVVTIKHGQNLNLNTIIDFKMPIVGDENALKAFKEELAKEFGSRQMAEFSAAGITIVLDNNTINNAKLRLGYGVQKEDRREYYPMEVGQYFNYIELKEGISEYKNYRLHHYIISGTGITKDSSVMLRLSVPYAYVNGYLTITDEELGFDTYEVDFDIIVEDSSSYDKPNPIENQEDLITACNAQGGDYILLNNIVLENWTPIDATFASLDGNGYVIKIKSFSLTNVRNQDSVNFGVFSTTNEGTLLKNITVDVSQMLITESEMLERLDKVASSSADTYMYDANIDLSYIKNVNFGILVGTNNGSITNAKIINTNAPSTSSVESRLYFHVVTTQGYLENTLVSTKIGGIAGINGEKGAITNSFVGLNKSTMEGNNSYVQIINNASDVQYNNETDKLEATRIYPFVLAGGNTLAGMVAENNGVISNSYVKALGLYNTFPAVKDSKTAGFVATNNGTATSCFVESKDVNNYRAVEDTFKIESTGNIGGFVYLNSSVIENSYSNVYLETQSAFTGGFVFNNDTAGKISNSYTTTVNTNNIARGQFTGVGDNGRDVLNSGTYYNCYYLVLGNESVNDNEYATAMIGDKVSISDKNAWRGFSFTTEANSEGIWILKEDSTPEIASSILDTNSFRQLSGKETVSDGDVSYEVYSYEYINFALGSKNNPLIIDKASNFATYIIDNAVDINGQYVFGVSQNSHSNIFSDMNVVRYVRIVNNLDFEKITSSTMHKGTYLYKLIFAGVLDGNGMSLSNLNINTETVQLDNFGLFAQVGVESSVSTNQTVIKNINLDVRTYKSSDSSRAGVLAGTIVNSNIINVKINGNSTEGNSAVIGGRNMAGALAGLIYADDNGTISLYDVEVENVNIEASFGSLGGEITDDSVDMSYGFYNKFKIKNVETGMDIEKSFVSLYNKTTNKTELFDKDSKIRTDVSYTGAIAGVILANNYSINVGTASNIDNYRTSPDTNTIDNLVVKGSLTIRTADNSGGLFGYIGENTLIKNSKFILGDNQIIRAFNYAGGIVAENHGVIEQCSVALEDTLQETYDNNIIDKTSEQKNNYQLFDKLDSKDYTVSIGGIAGYSNNGVIIDSYSKINVIKPQAYIAGGIIGYGENYNYIGYTYYSGAIYSKFITGGLVGLQANSSKPKLDDDGNIIYDDHGNIIYDNKYLILNNAYSLVDWNYSTTDYDFRQKNIEKLYENQKVMYTKLDGTYYIFYVKMPEIGNLNVQADSDKITSYSSLHNSFYLGSTIGYVIMNTIPNTALSYTYPSKAEEDTRRLLNASDIANYKLRESSNVVTNTLGLYSTSGSLASGNKVDNYFSSVFNYYVDNTNYINLYSLRVSYNVGSLNSYDLKAIDDAKPDDYFDIFTYPKVYNQEYTEQMLGTYSDIKDDRNVTTANIFKYAYDGNDRYTKTNSDSTFICADNDHIWAMSKYLPKFSYGMYTSGKTITNKDELTEALTTFSSGKVYKIAPNSANYTIELDTINAVNKNIAYTQTIKDVYMGVPDGSGKNPKIVINVNGTNEQIENLSTVNSIFNILSGVTFSNIDFEINYGENVNLKADKIYSNFGFFANTLQNATISNCSFTLEFANDISFEKNDLSNSTFNCNNIGLMFGNVNNSTITDSTFVITAKNIVLADEKISNFGLFAGIIENSAITNNTFNIITSGVTISEANTSLNVGGVAGVLNYSTYRNKASDIIDNYTDKKFIINNAKDLNQLNIATLFAFANNANITNIALSSNLDIINRAKVNELNIAHIVAMSNACNISNVSTGSTLNISEGTGSEVQTINVGAIIGYDLKSSTLGNGLVKSSANINVYINSMNMSVGGLVGLSSNATNLITLGQCNGEINVTNEGKGNKTYDEKGNDIITLANISVGGILGKSQGIVGLSNVLSTAKISMKKTAKELVKVAVGGIIGTSNASTEINNFSSLATIAFDSSQTYENNFEVYVSGAIGLNNGLFVGNNGFVLVELPKISNALTTAVTNGSISRTTQNVFYCQELLGNYENDCNFDTYALADLYGSLSEYCKLGQIVALGKNSFFATENMKLSNNLVVFIPKGTSIDDSELNNAIYTPNEISSDITGVALSSYNVILNDITMSSVTINDSAVVSGRTLATGNVEITTSNTSGNSVTQYSISTNNGVISNIYFKTTGGTNSAQNVALVDTNNGLITNVYVYGFTTAQYAIANTNEGQIYKSVSATIYEGSKDSIYGLVNTNSETGIISDCYSSSFAHILNTTNKINVYGFAKTNLGIIKYSFYSIPEIMEYENEVKGYAEITSSGEGASKVQGSTFRCEMSTMPTFVDTRTTIWTKENDHGQIIGFKDIEGAIVIKLTMDTGSEVIYDLNEMKGYLRQNNYLKTYTFGYEINFYSDEKLGYQIVRFNNGNKFANYINSLTYTSIPSNIVIILDGNLSINGDIKAFSIPSSSMVIGINNCVVDYTGSNYITHELIKTNNGVIANITFTDFNFNNTNDTKYFAPIVYNYGTIYNVVFKGDTNISVVRGGTSAFVAGIVSINGVGGVINKCGINKLTIYTAEYYNFICNESYGKVYDCYAINYAGVGSLYPNGKNGLGDND